MKNGIEINGVANLYLIVQMALEDGSIKQAAADKILDQCDALERYMIAHHKDPNVKWHEVRDNREQYQLNGGRSK